MEISDETNILKRIKKLEEEVVRLTENQKELVAVLKGAGLVKFKRPGSQYEPRPIPK